MYLTREKNSRLQLIDFGFARRVDEEKEYEEIGACCGDFALKSDVY